MNYRYSPFIQNKQHKFINQKRLFPKELKLAEVSPIFKKEDDLDKENYRPVSVLPHVSKIFEKIMHHQINDYMKDKLLKQITGLLLKKSQHTVVC